jgi:Fic family protein
MFKPQFTFTSKLLSNISNIERIYGQLEALKIPKKLELNLKRDNLIQSSYVSNSIEGNPMSLREVTNLLLGDRVPVNRDEKEVKNYFNILQNLSELSKKELDIDLTNQIHKNLLAGVKDEIAGQIRNKKVVVGKYSGEHRESLSLEVKHEPPHHQKNDIISALKELYSWFKNQGQPVPLSVGIFHHHFVYIHPYIDGNGRVCRLLTALVFCQHNYQINKYFVLDDYYDIDRMLYSDKLHSADKGDKTEWLEYFTDGVLYSLQGSLARVKEGLSRLKIEDRPTVKEKQVLDIVEERRQVTSTQIADVLDVSRQQAHSLLSSLVEKGILEKKGTTKGSYYFIK